MAGILDVAWITTPVTTRQTMPPSWPRWKKRFQSRAADDADLAALGSTFDPYANRGGLVDMLLTSFGL